MTRATSDEGSESRQPSWWRVCSSWGVHVRVGYDLFEAEINDRLIRLASSLVDFFIINFSVTHNAHTE